MKTEEIIEQQNRQIVKLQNSLASKEAYIKALEEQCRLANELLKAHKHGDALRNALETITP